MPQRVARPRRSARGRWTGRGPEWGQLLGYRRAAASAVGGLAKPPNTRSIITKTARVCAHGGYTTSEDFFTPNHREHWRFSDLGRYADNQTDRGIYWTVAFVGKSNGTRRH